MKPKQFPEANVIFAKDQPEYSPLPAFKAEGLNGEVITCWQLSFWERCRLLFKGEFWLSMMTFHRPLTPVFISTRKRDVLVSIDRKSEWKDLSENLIDESLSPADKAKQLVKKYYSFVSGWTTTNKPGDHPSARFEGEEMKIGRAKQCALVAIEEVMHLNLMTEAKNETTFRKFEMVESYWNKVKNEIGKL